MSTVHTAMILAAGRGERLRPLTDTTPKPLVRVAGRTLIEHHLRALDALGMRRAVVNLHHLGADVRAHVEALEDLRIECVFSPEPTLLETAGGIAAALPLLGTAPFLVVNADVYCDFDLGRLVDGPGEALAHMVMVPRPPWVTHGDFDLTAMPPDHEQNVRTRLALGTDAACTYAGLGVYAPALFADVGPGPMALRPLLDAAIAAGRLTGELHTGVWEDIGTPERLARARARHGD